MINVYQLFLPKDLLDTWLKKNILIIKKTTWFFKAVGCISVDRSVHDGKAKGEAIETLKNGGAIGLFPEGTRNKTQEFLLPFKFGAVSMAKKQMLI